MPKPRISAALRDALTELQAGADPDQVAASLIKTRQEAVVLRSKLPTDDPRRPLLDLLVRALGARTFDDSSITLEAVLADMRGHGDHATN